MLEIIVLKFIKKKEKKEVGTYYIQITNFTNFEESELESKTCILKALV